MRAIIPVVRAVSSNHSGRPCRIPESSVLSVPCALIISVVRQYPVIIRVVRAVFSNHLYCPCRILQTLGAGGKPSTRFPPGTLVELAGFKTNEKFEKTEKVEKKNEKH